MLQHRDAKSNASAHGATTCDRTGRSFAPREQWSELHAILDEIAYLADRTRSLRQQLHVSRMRPIASA